MTNDDTTRQIPESEKGVRKVFASDSQSEVQKAAGSKLTPAYWQHRVFRPTYSVGRQRRLAGEFYAQIQHAGRREKVAMGASQREKAARRAAKLYAAIRVKGWETALLEFQPDREAVQTADTLTVGAFLEAARPLLEELNTRTRTIANYAYALRKVATEATGNTAASKARFDPVHCPWRKDADRILLAKLTPAKVEAWKADFVARVPGAADKQHARRSVNSYLRNARSLFSKKLLKRYRATGLELPDPLPFDGIELESKKDLGSTRYISTIDAPTLLQAARAELRSANCDAYGVVLLALGAGLRRAEIDSLQWPAVDFEGGKIRVVNSDGFQAKTEESQGTVFVDSGLLAELAALRQAKARTLYVIAPNTERPATRAAQSYRADVAFDTATAWLRSKGVLADKPLHTLRKEFGSLVNEKADIFTASRQLRHANLATTSEVYADNRKRAVVEIGAMLAPPTAATAAAKG